MNIAFCVIVEGDEKLEGLKKLVASVKDYVSGVYITTNGKHIEKTVKWCEEEGIHHSHLPWEDDFAAQRNFNFSQVPSDTDYVLWADSDDVILDAKYIPQIAKAGKVNGYDSIFFPYWYGCRFDGEPSPETLLDVELQQTRERLLKYGATVWKGRIHETPVPLNGENHVYSKTSYSDYADASKGLYPTVWLHLGADRNMPEEDMTKRTERNQRILEKQLLQERETSEADPRTILYLMKIYADSDDYDTLKTCISLGEEYMKKSGWDAERALCASLVSRCLGKLGDNEQAIKMLHAAVQEYPHDPLLYLQLARAYFNVKNYRSMKHWMDVGMSMDLDKIENTSNNLLELKILSTELTMRYHLEVDRDPEKAWKSARLLTQLNPVEANKKVEEYLFNTKELNNASRNAHQYLKYLESIEEYSLIPETIKNMPKSMQNLPFAINLYNRYVEPRVWGEKEICYYATFGNKAIEPWSPKSLETGLGGSETAVIRLSREWVKMGYKVTVYGDPGKEEGEHDGVTYLPWYRFNPRDRFNIFIQWRWGSLAGKVGCKKFLVDLHDVFYEYDYKDKLDAIDRFMVKSDYHRRLAPLFPDEKFQVISNGI